MDILSIKAEGKVIFYDLKTEDNWAIQMVVIGGRTACLPTQIGCAHRCNICSARGLVRNLTVKEFDKLLDFLPPIDLYSFMGQGEPLDNDNLYSVIPLIRGEVAISTIVPSFVSLKRFASTFPDVKIQLSSHCMDVGRLADALRMLSKHKHVTINYVGPKIEFTHIAKLAYAFRRKIKLSRGNYEGYVDDREQLAERLRRQNVEFEIYEHDGASIGASCGQHSSYRVKP